MCLSFGPQPGPASSSTSISTIVSTPLTTLGTLIFFFFFGGAGCCIVSLHIKLVTSPRQTQVTTSAITSCVLGRCECRFKDSRIGATAAEISLARLANFRQRGIGVLFQIRRYRGHKSRCAETAHQSVLIYESSLHRIQFVRRTKPFDRRNLFAHGIDSEYQT